MYEARKRLRGVTLKVMDLTGYSKSATDFYRSHELEDQSSVLKPGYEPYAFAEHDGDLFVVCNEGVGWKVTDEEPFVVEFNAETKTDDGYSFSLFPVVSVSLSPDEVRKSATGESVDLADLVRKFGGRLEDNFWLWYNTLTERKAS